MFAGMALFGLLWLASGFTKNSPKNHQNRMKKSLKNHQNRELNADINHYMRRLADPWVCVKTS